MRISTPLGEDVLLLERFSGTEGVSMPFEFTAGLLSEDSAIDMDGLLRQPVSIALRLVDGADSCFHGIVSRIVQLESGIDQFTAYEATIVPSTYRLTLEQDCRIFQNKTVQQIIEAILGDAGISDYRFSLTGSYPAREYCVQYRETDWDFINRLCESEGIFYFYTYSGSSHMLIFADAPSAITPCPSQAIAHLTQISGGIGLEDVVWQAGFLKSVYTSKVALQDFNFEQPSLDLMATDEPGTHPEQVYDYPGGYITLAEGERYAKVRGEEIETHTVMLRGRGGCRGFRAGYRFELKDHTRDAANQNYSLIRVTHLAEDANYRTSEPKPFSYENSFDGIPHSQKFRPFQRTRKALVQGVQTAKVVGPSGEEIYVDNYGRVKVKFHWDRLGHSDGEDSCWVRVAQIWAGNNWGWMSIPRVGQEVIVDFLEGDPDRPIVVGRVYNQEEMPPYTLPDNKTQSGIKSRSSPGGGAANFNEFRFEDKAGSEEVYLHAEKDWKIMVEHDETEDVTHDNTITIGHNRTETVSNDESITISHNRTESVGNEESITIGTKRSTSIGQKDELSVGQEQSISVGQKITVTAGMEITLQAGPNTIKLGPAGITIQTPAIVTIQGSLVKIN